LKRLNLIREANKGETLKPLPFAYNADDTAILSKYNCTEKAILDEVWKRINSKANEKNYDELYKALAVNIEDGKNYCTVGRVDRILDTLTLLDVDPLINTPTKTLDILRKEILEKAYKMLQDALKEKPIEFQTLYNETETKETKEFTTVVLDNIKTYVYETYKDDKETLDRILKEVEAGF
jgi:Skp family chaperone for outer membrane proteins